MPNCSKCGGITTYKKGVSKKGNAYEGYHCDDQQCGNMDFINRPKQQGPSAKGINPDIELLKLAVQLAINTNTSGDIFEEIKKHYKALRFVLNSPVQNSPQSQPEEELQIDM